MPLSYYIDKPPCCSFCGAKRDTVHIGESLHGEVFRFRYDRDRGLTTPAKWFDFLKDKRIVCEAGHESDVAWIKGYPIIECPEPELVD